jgi:hypothetical protein
MAVLTVVVAMMMIHHPGRPFLFPFRSTYKTWKAMDQIYVNEEERGRTY